jgi:hypothetical protein
LFLKSDLRQLEHMTSLPEVVEGLGLLLAADALRFALGHKVELPSGVVAEEAGENADHQFFAQWREQPAFEALPARPGLCSATTNLPL